MPQYTVGFAFQGGQWGPTAFRPGPNYILRRASREELGIFGARSPNASWGVLEQGDNTPYGGCTETTPDMARIIGNMLHCSGGADFELDRGNLRFQMVFKGNYTNPSAPEARSDTPSLSIGYCTPL